MNYLDIWTEEEVDIICMYYGQIPENLPYNLKAILVEKFENQVFNKCKSIIKKINKNDKIIPYVYRYGECSEDNNPSLFCNK